MYSDGQTTRGGRETDARARWCSGQDQTSYRQRVTTGEGVQRCR